MFEDKLNDFGTFLVILYKIYYILIQLTKIIIIFLYFKAGEMIALLGGNKYVYENIRRIMVHVMFDGLFLSNYPTYDFKKKKKLLQVYLVIFD